MACACVMIIIICAEAVECGTASACQPQMQYCLCVQQCVAKQANMLQLRMQLNTAGAQPACRVLPCMLATRVLNGRVLYVNVSTLYCGAFVAQRSGKDCGYKLW